MKMDRVDLNDPCFDLCKYFVKTCNKGKGQNIHFTIDKNTVVDFLNTKASEFYKNEAGDFWHPKRYESYIQKAMKAVEKAVRLSSSSAYFLYSSSGDWQGTNRRKELLEFEKKLKTIKEVYSFLDYINIDYYCFNYIDNFNLDGYDNLIISIEPCGVELYPDLEKLIKFLEMLGYQRQKSQAVNLKTIWFYDLDVKKISENKEIWEFL